MQKKSLDLPLVASIPDQADQGPQPLDPALWSLVQGGLPRGGGWSDPDTPLATTDDLPRGGGWETA